jgi:hypothetical protein
LWVLLALRVPLAQPAQRVLRDRLAPLVLRVLLESLGLLVSLVFQERLV